MQQPRSSAVCNNDRITGIVKINTEQARFELETSAGFATVEYHQEEDVLIIFYTEVPPPLRGNGIGQFLMRGALEQIERCELKIVPRCSFARAFIERNPQFRALIA